MIGYILGYIGIMENETGKCYPTYSQLRSLVFLFSVIPLLTPLTKL